MGSEDRHHLRTTFEQVAELYDRARPLYPTDLFDDLVTLAGLSSGSRLLEIGCGTGHATAPLARRGFEIVCVELGTQLAAVARRKLAPFGNVRVVNAPFEAWEPEGDVRFDAIVAFTAFHWIDPEARYAKSAGLLRPGGALAIVSTEHVLPEDGDRFFVEVQEDYDAVVSSDDNRPPSPPDDVPDLSAEIDASGHFVLGWVALWSVELAR